MDDTERRALARAASWARPIGAYAARALDPAARARGFATTALLSEWPAIVGAELAQFTMPDKVVWPKRRDDAEEASPQRGRRGEGAILVLRVEGPRAIEVQHRSGQILERVNCLFRLSGRGRDAHLAGAGDAQGRALSRFRSADRPRCASPLSGHRGSGLARRLAAARLRHAREAHKRLRALSRSCQEAGLSTKVGAARA